MTDISELVKDLAIARNSLEFEKSILSDINEEIEQSYGEHIGVAKINIGKAQSLVSDIDAKLRQAAIDLYNETGEKKPHPALVVKIYTVLNYESAKALEYCRQHLPGALSFNKAKFEKVAMVAELDFVEIDDDDPRPSIASDLSQWVA